MELLKTSERPLNQVARELGVCATSLRRWRDALREVSSALDRAISTVPPAGDALFHSDRGCRIHLREDAQTPRHARDHAEHVGQRQLLRPRQERELLRDDQAGGLSPDDCCFDTRVQARRAIFDYIETFYNRRRRHSALGYISP